MKIKLIVFDVDGTLTEHPSSWQFLHEHLNVWDGNADRHQKRFLAGKISYAEFCRLDAEHWKGMRAARIQKILGRIPYTKNARRYIFLLKKKGIKLNERSVQKL
jgi:phosphoserine phosphatase